MGRGIDQLKGKIKNHNSGYKPVNVAEIGSMDGRDAINIANYWNISRENIYIFEAHPQLCEQIKKSMNDVYVYNYAITDKNVDKITFNAVELNTGGNGLSSVLDRNEPMGVNFNEVEVDARRIDKFLEDNSLHGFDIVKIDAEGYAYNVLNSFGKYLNNTDYFQVEAEVFKHWKTDYMRDSVVEFMENNNFTLIDEYGGNSQKELLFQNNKLSS